MAPYTAASSSERVLLQEGPEEGPEEGRVLLQVQELLRQEGAGEVEGWQGQPVLVEGWQGQEVLGEAAGQEQEVLGEAAGQEQQVLALGVLSSCCGRCM